VLTELTLNVTTIAIGAAVVLQIVLMAQLVRAQRTAGRSGRRVEQLTAALELLTDTTEAGFVNVATELERVGARPIAPTATRRATTRRIAASARHGHAIDEIAASEGLSESEVRLHLGLADAARQAEAADEDEEESRAGVLDDLERWMQTLGRRPESGGARHAAVRV
jgi:hypothetical protein